MHFYRTVVHYDRDSRLRAFSDLVIFFNPYYNMYVLEQLHIIILLKCYIACIFKKNISLKCVIFCGVSYEYKSFVFVLDHPSCADDYDVIILLCIKKRHLLIKTNKMITSIVYYNTTIVFIYDIPLKLVVFICKHVLRTYVYILSSSSCRLISFVNKDIANNELSYCLYVARASFGL